MKHRSGCSDCVHNKANGIDVWHCTEVDSEIDALIDSANQQIEDIFFSCVKVEQAQWNAWLATCEQVEQLWVDNMTD